MNNFTIKTTLSIPEKTEAAYQSSIEGDGPCTNEILYSLLHSHITLLQKELETLELIMKRNTK